MNIKELNKLVNVEHLLGLCNISPDHMQGDEFQIICPFHEDTQPSMSINCTKRVYHCFGCGAGGDMVDFYARHKNLSMKQAADTLATMYGVDITLNGGLKSSEEETARWLMEQRKRHKNTNKSIPTSMIEEYSKHYGELIKSEYWREMGFPKSVIDFFELGVKNGRLFIPIRDDKGEFIAYSTRALESNPDNGRYIHMKGFQKSTIIYNFNNVSKLLDEGECDIIMLTEGFSDVWRAFSHGFLKCAAIMGKEATQQQIDLLLKHTYRVCLAFDRDRAGEEGMKSFWDKTKNLVEIEWLKIPKGKDLGSLSKNEFWELYNGRVKV